MIDFHDRARGPRRAGHDGAAADRRRRPPSVEGYRLLGELVASKLARRARGLTSAADGDHGRAIRPLLAPAGVRGLPRDDPQDGRRAGRAAGRGDRREGRVPARHPRAVRLPRPARAAVRARARRHRHRHADAQHRGRGDREGVRLLGPDPDDPGARHAADPPLRLRRAQAAVPAEVRLRRVEPGVRALGARRRLGPGRDAHQGGARRRRVGDRGDQELDLQPRRRRLLHLLRGHQPRRGPLARDLGLRRRGRPARASRSASSSTRWGSAARPPASRSSTTSASRPRT